MIFGKKILITGVSGYIGSCLYSHLKKKYQFVYGLDKSKPSKLSRVKKKDFFKCNLLNSKKLNKVIKLIKPNIIIHLAAQSTVDPKISKKKYFINNVQTTKNLISSMKDFNLSKIIFSSTAAVYKEKNSRISEDDKISAKSYYGKSKVAAENLIKKNKKVKFIILRFFNVSGALLKPLIGEMHFPETHFIPTLVYKSLKNQTIRVFGKNYNTYDGTCIRDYIHISDICHSIEKSIVHIFKKNYKSKIINVGNGIGISNLQILESLKNKLKYKIKILFTKRRVGDSEKLVCNIEKSRKNLNWKPRNSKIEKIITDEIIWSKHLLKRGFKRFKNQT